MNFTILVRPNAEHQLSTARKFRAGLAKHGYSAEITADITKVPKDDVIVTWGWRRGSSLADNGRRVLVMERAYVGDRFEWISFGWDLSLIHI
mgnify:CR=1 FL=1